MRPGLLVPAAMLAAVAGGLDAGDTGVAREAAAQSAAPAGAEPVQRRRPPDDRGVRLGSFLTYLAADVTSTYVDNVFATDTNRQRDLITAGRANLAVASDWRRHGLSLRAGALTTRHLRFTGENTQDYRASVDGFVDVMRETRIGTTASLAREHEDRASPNDSRSLEPTRLERRSVRVDATHDMRSLGLAFVGSYETLDFADGPLPGPSVVNNDDRDRTLIGATMRIDAGRRAPFRPFVQGAYDVAAYRLPRDDNGFDRDSRGLEAALGAAFDIATLGQGEIALGYRRQAFDDADLETASGLTASLDLTSDLGEATRLRLGGGRRLRETTVAGSSGFFETSTRLHLQHQLMRRVEVDAELSFAVHDFRGIDRRDDTYRAGVGLTYLYFRQAALVLRYDFTRRESDAEADFSLNRFSVGTRWTF